MSRFRILSLDGGGIKGTFTASYLAHIEKMTGKRVVDYFDLITGTSTGGLIALGLGLEVPAEDILQFYVDRGPEIFPSTGADRVLHGLWHAIRPKYSQRILNQALLNLLGDRLVGHSKCRLVIPSYDCNAGHVQLFKTAHHERFVQDYRLPASEAAMATAAAPTYFPAFNASDGQTFLDGGVWANCPIVIGLLEAMFVLGNSPASIDVLSIGTTEEPFDVSKKKGLGGFLVWNRQLVDLPMQAQIDGALAQAQIITGKRATRIDAMARRGRFTLDDANQIESLRGLGARTAKDSIDEVSTRFFDAPADKFVPCHELVSETQRPPERCVQPTQRRRRRRSLGFARTGWPRLEHRIVDISVTGAFLETDCELPVGDPLDLDLALETGETANVRAKVVRIQHPRWGAASGVGVSFTDFGTNARGIIERYVAAEPIKQPTGCDDSSIVK